MQILNKTQLESELCSWNVSIFIATKNHYTCYN